MIIEEFFELNGVSHVRRYSDRNLMIAAEDGVEYEVAEDLVSVGKVYNETETPVPPDEQTIEDKAEAYDILMGVGE
jgi:hypothetical protein